MNKIESYSNLNSIKEQREELLLKNPDILVGVYKVLEMNDKEIKLELQNDLIACYPDKLENLVGLESAPDINIIDLIALRKGVKEFLYGSDTKIKDELVLLSGGVIDYIENKFFDSQKNLILLLRNSSGVGSLEYTSVAGRNTGENLIEELEKELYEEAPFLGKSIQGEYCLAIPEGNDKGKEYTIDGINLFLEYFYNLNNNDKEDQYFIKQFEENFPGIKYEELGGLLREIIHKDNFVEYGWKKGNIPELSDNIKTLSVGENKIQVYIYRDESNNTIEYRDIRKITKLPDGFKLLGKGPSRLNLESSNQVPIYHILGNQLNKATPTIKIVNEQVRNAIN